jgi:maltose O-acetyltransferase
LTRQLNDSGDDEVELRRELFGSTGTNLLLEPPFYCDYGSNIYIGDNVFFNFNCVVLDVTPVTIGSDTMFGPAVQIYTATHPLEASERLKGLEAGTSITIGSGVWVGGGAMLLPGVTVGDRSVIGAGSVVTRDIPPDVFAAGNPCRVIRELA